MLQAFVLEAAMERRDLERPASQRKGDSETESYVEGRGTPKRGTPTSL